MKALNTKKVRTRFDGDDSGSEQKRKTRGRLGACIQISQFTRLQIEVKKKMNTIELSCS